MKVAVILLTLALAIPAFAQDKPPPTLSDLKKDLTIINLRIENMELRYVKLKDQQKRLSAHIKQLEASAKKPQVDEPKPK